VSRFALLFAASFAFVSACGPAQSPKAAGGSADQVGAVHGGCVQEMLRSTCRVLNDKSDVPASEVVLIAGVGRVDAASYRALREAGEGMCAQVQTACAGQWDGAPCRTARALWGGAAHKPL
jgi:hypothetical protein